MLQYYHDSTLGNQYDFIFQISGLIGMADVNTDIFSNRLEEMLPVIQLINEQFKDPVRMLPILQF